MRNYFPVEMEDGYQEYHCKPEDKDFLDSPTVEQKPEPICDTKKNGLHVNAATQDIPINRIAEYIESFKLKKKGD